YAVVVVSVKFQNPAQMLLTKNDDMIQALAADRPNLIVENKRHPLYDKHALGRVYDREKTNRRTRH
ncbi:MAG TPA: hypothetical protein VIJ35_11650, partial [Bradyrhizobium sp.]